MDQKLDPDQILKAVKALYAFIKTKKEGKAGGKSALFDDDVESDLYLNINVFRMPSKGKNKPVRIPIKHSLMNEGEFCLITKDPESDFSAYLESHPVRGCKKVLGLRQLKDNFTQYKDKRELMSSYDMFMADDRILSILPRLLSKAFFQRKKQPVPVVIAGKNWEKHLEQARDSTYFFHASGVCTTVRIAKASFTPAQVVENVLSAINAIVAQIPFKWQNIQSLRLSTATSQALPIFTQLPEGGFESADATEISNTKKGPIKPATPAQASEAAPAPDNQSKKRKAPVSEAAAAPVSEPAPVKKLKADAPPAPAAVKKSDEKKLTDKKTVEKKSMETKPAEKKSMETKPAEKKLSGAQNSSRPGTASAKVPVKAAPAQPVKAAPVPPATGGASAKTGGGLVSKKRGGHGGNA